MEEFSEVEVLETSVGRLGGGSDGDVDGELRWGLRGEQEEVCF